MNHALSGADVVGISVATVASLGFLVVAAAAIVFQRAGVFCLMMGNSFLADTITASFGHSALWFRLFVAAVAAVCYWLWWRVGGGNNTKRRLKSLWRKFKPVRRTAPVLGGA